MRKFYLTFPTLDALASRIELDSLPPAVRVENDKARNFYLMNVQRRTGAPGRWNAKSTLLL